MDSQRDYDNFRKLMGRLCATMDKFITDELVESWWKALRTVSYATVERRIDEFIARAGEKTKFPRPGQIRPDDAPMLDAKEAEREWRIGEENARNWRAHIAEFPTTGPIRYKLALCSRIIVTEHESSPAYAEAIDQERWLLKQLGEHGRFCADH